MKRKVKGLFRMLGMSVVVVVFFGAVECYAKPMKTTETTKIYAVEDDVLQSTDLHFEENSLIDAYYDETVEMDGGTWVHAYGQVYKDGETEWKRGNGYVKTDALEEVSTDGIRNAGDLSYREMFTLYCMADDIIYNQTNQSTDGNLDGLLRLNRIDFRVAGHCALVTLNDKNSYMVEFLFTAKETAGGDYQTLYLEKDGKRVFGGYEPLLETDLTETYLLKEKYYGFTYPETAEEDGNDKGLFGSED